MTFNLIVLRSGNIVLSARVLTAHHGNVLSSINHSLRSNQSQNRSPQKPEGFAHSPLLPKDRQATDRLKQLGGRGVRKKKKCLALLAPTRASALRMERSPVSEHFVPLWTLAIHRERDDIISLSRQ